MPRKRTKKRPIRRRKIETSMHLTTVTVTKGPGKRFWIKRAKDLKKRKAFQKKKNVNDRRPWSPEISSGLNRS